MGLSCECFDNEDSTLGWYENPGDFSTIKETDICSSCDQKIDVGDIVIRIDGYRHPNEDEQKEWAIADDHEIPLDPIYLCEKCGDIYFSLNELGFCMSPHDSMSEILHEYHETYGSKTA